MKKTDVRAPEVLVMSIADLERGRAVYNPRVMPADEAAALKGSIERFGELQPIVWNKRTKRIVGGHQRLTALRELGRKQVAVFAVDLAEDEERAANLALNKIHGEWDWGKLKTLLDELGEMNAELPAIAGFTDEELRRIENDGHLLSLQMRDARMSRDEINAAANEVDQDEVPLPPKDPVTRRGDLWILGEHRLLCGDSSSPEDLDRLLEGQEIHLVNTDPPYGVATQPRSRRGLAAGSRGLPNSVRRNGAVGALRARDRPIANDSMPTADFEKILLCWFQNAARVLKPGRAAYFWGGYANFASYPAALAAAGFYFSQAIVWVKAHPVINRKDFMGDHEWCFYCWKEGAAHQFFGPENVTDVWTVKKVPPQEMCHLTEKPVELAARAIKYSSKKGENVLDLFGGSGSTIIACEHTGRRGFSLEIDPAYCDVIVERWEKMTGQVPFRDGYGGSGKTIPELQAAIKRRTEPRAGRPGSRGQPPKASASPAAPNGRARSKRRPAAAG